MVRKGVRDAREKENGKAVWWQGKEEKLRKLLACCAKQFSFWPLTWPCAQTFSSIPKAMMNMGWKSGQKMNRWKLSQIGGIEVFQIWLFPGCVTLSCGFPFANHELIKQWSQEFKVHNQNWLNDGSVVKVGVQIVATTSCHSRSCFLYYNFG